MKKYIGLEEWQNSWCILRLDALNVEGEAMFYPATCFDLDEKK